MPLRCLLVAAGAQRKAKTFLLTMQVLLFHPVKSLTPGLTTQVRICHLKLGWGQCPWKNSAGGLNAEPIHSSVRKWEGQDGYWGGDRHHLPLRTKDWAVRRQEAVTEWTEKEGFFLKYQK